MPIRPIQPAADALQVAAMHSQVERETVTPADIERWCAHLPPGRVAHRLVTTDAQDAATGYGMALHEPGWPAGHFYVWVVIDPAWRGRGLGAALYQTVRAFVDAQGANLIKSEVRDDDAVGQEFARLRGFEIDRHLFESSLDLKTFDPGPYRDLPAGLEAAGLRFFSLAEVGNSPENRRKLYEINHSTALDIPGMIDDSFSTFEEFEHWVCGADWFSPSGQLLAADGDAWVGLSAVQLEPELHGSYNLMTGVLPAYRGRKIALALKLRAIQYAQAHGAYTMRTHNDSLNHPMLAINRKLGYRSQPGKYLLIQR